MKKYTNEEILNAMGRLSVFQFVELMETMKSRFEIEILQPTIAPAPVVQETKPVKDADEFTVVLVDAGPRRMEIMKEVKALTGKTLLESKGMVDKLPSKIHENVSQADAQSAKERLEALGAKVELN